MTTQDLAEKATSAFIEDFVKKYWEDHKTVCYLSTLGLRVKHDVPESKLALSTGLHDFLRQNPIVKIVEYPGIKQKVGAVPLSIDIPDDVTNLFGTNRPKTSPGEMPSYDQEFWDAFIRPIDGGARFVCINQDGIVTVSNEKIQQMEVQCYEILPQDLTKSCSGGEISDRVASTHDAINSWLKKHSLEQRSFIPRKKRKLETAASSRLGAFLSAFDGISREDMARIEIPLDILVKLNSGK